MVSRGNRPVKQQICEDEWLATTREKDFQSLSVVIIGVSGGLATTGLVVGRRSHVGEFKINMCADGGQTIDTE
jgi:hypothetical protein